MGRFEVKRVFVFVIRCYQILLSPFLGRNCRFYPTCSSYAIESIQNLGVVRGSWFAFKRIMRCHPFSDGGFDPAPQKKPTEPFS